MLFAAALYAIVIHGGSGSGSTASLELWQVINLVGVPLLALMFLPMALEDLSAWIRSR